MLTTALNFRHTASQYLQTAGSSLAGLSIINNTRHYLSEAKSQLCRHTDQVRMSWNDFCQRPLVQRTVEKIKRAEQYIAHHPATLPLAFAAMSATYAAASIYGLGSAIALVNTLPGQGGALMLNSIACNSLLGGITGLLAGKSADKLRNSDAKTSNIFSRNAFAIAGTAVGLMVAPASIGLATTGLSVAVALDSLPVLIGSLAGASLVNIGTHAALGGLAGYMVNQVDNQK